MNELPVDWLGRSGPHILLVKLTPDEFRDLLQKTLTTDSAWDGFLAQSQGFTGEVKDGSFSIRSCWRNHSAHPTISGQFEAAETGVRVRFQIEMDPTFLIILILFGCLTIGSILVYSIGSLLGRDIEYVLNFFPFAPFAAAFLVFFGWHTRNRSKVLLGYFLNVVEDCHA